MPDLTSDQVTNLGRLMAEGNVLEEIEGTIRTAAARFLEVGAADLNAFANRLSAQLVWAGMSGNAEVMASVARQTRLLAELQRVRATDAAWDTFWAVVEQATTVAVRVATNLLLAGAARLEPSE